MRMKSGIALVLMLIGVIPFAGCGGGGSSTPEVGGTPTALKVAEKVSVVDAQQEAATAAVAALNVDFGQVKAMAVPADSDYSKDPSNVWVEERSAETFNMVNEILCWMAQTRYDAMMNKGDYIAQIDVGQCSPDKDDASNAGQKSQNQSSTSNKPEYEFWTINSSRVDNSSPHIVIVWAHEKGQGEDPSMTIFVKTVITEGKSATNPYGIFTTNFHGYAENPDGSIGMEMMKGYLRTVKEAGGKVLLRFITNQEFTMGTDTIQFKEQATLDRSADGLQGGGTVYNYESGPWMPGPREVKFNFQFDEDHFLRKDATSGSVGNAVCLNRKEFNKTVWSYGLYNSTTGSSVSISLGFPVKYTDGTTGESVHGWVGYYGLSFPNNIAIQSGDTVYKETYGPGGGEATAYTAFIAGGRLVKHEKKALTLSDVKNIPLTYNEWDPMTGMGTDYRVTWDGTDFVEDATRGDSTNWMWKDLVGGPVAMDLSAMNWTDLNFWSESLGGSVRVNLGGEMGANCAPNTDGTFDCSGFVPAQTAVIFYSENMVYPGDTVPSTLSCFEQCPNPPAMNDGDPDTPDYFDTWNMSQQPVAPALANTIDYTFGGTSYILAEGSSGASVVKTDTDTDWGTMSGPLFDKTDPNVQAALECPDWDMDPNTHETCGWQAWSNLPVFYTWETGPNDWQRFTGLKDGSGSFVKFDPPLQVEYVHSQTDASAPDYKYNGSKFYLEYNGFGDLWGIPGTCVDMDSGEPVDCGSGGENRWVPEFNIPTGATVTDNMGGANYLVKQLEAEQRMKLSNQGDPGDVSVCTGAGLAADASYTLPLIADWEDPAIGDEPEVTDPPAVVGGVLQ